MITVIVILCLLSIKDEIDGIIDLYSTLQGNLKAYAINYLVMGFIGVNEFYFDFWIMNKINLSYTKFIAIQSIVLVVGCFFGVLTVKYKGKIKNFIRKKRIAKRMTQKWKEKRDAKIQQEVPKELKPVPPKSPKDFPGGGEGI